LIEMIFAITPEKPVVFINSEVSMILIDSEGKCFEILSK